MRLSALLRFRHGGYHRGLGFGDLHAVADVSFAAEPGQVFGLLGPNGAGKTTMVKILLDLVRGYKGDARVFGALLWVRAALCGDAATARLARKYNHANVLVMSLRATSGAVGREIVEAFLDEPYGDDDFDHRNVAHVEALDDARAESS